jgi:hypothetical protein
MSRSHTSLSGLLSDTCKRATPRLHATPCPTAPPTAAPECTCGLAEIAAERKPNGAGQSKPGPMHPDPAPAMRETRSFSDILEEDFGPALTYRRGGRGKGGVSSHVWVGVEREGREEGKQAGGQGTSGRNTRKGSGAMCATGDSQGGNEK